MNKYPDFSILIVDDEPIWLDAMENMLRSTAGISNVILCDDSRKVMDILEHNDVGLILMDLIMPHLRGDALLEQVLAKYPDMLAIMITGLNDISNAVQCLKAGAYDYYVKTWGENRLSTGVQNALRLVEKDRESRQLSKSMLDSRLKNPEAFADIVTVNNQLLTIFSYIEAIAPTRTPVLITGESGVGKELIARAVHLCSGRLGKYLSVNMASLDGQMLDDTLFGHARGAYTNADGSRKGLIEETGGGTLFLDEIGELSSTSQAKLLRLIQEDEYFQLGSDTVRTSKSRLVLATNRVLEDEIATGDFRSDLYYRLNTHRIHIPPLRERREDIPLLIRHFILEISRELKKKPPKISGELTLALCQYAYPGNIRELKSLLTRAVSVAGKEFKPEDFGGLPEFRETAPDEQYLYDLFMKMDNLPSMNDLKTILTNVALARSGGNQTLAAKLLGISQPALSQRLSG